MGASLAVGGAVAAGPAVAGCDRTDHGHDESHTAVVRAQINGEHREITVDNRTSLLDMLRERAGLPGTKKGCDQGACGACTVLVNGRRINSCLTLAVMHDGAQITTIEGLAEQRQTASAPAGVHRRGRVPVRLLHTRPDHVRRRVYRRRARGLAGGDTRVDERQHLPLRGLHQHRQCSRDRGADPLARVPVPVHQGRRRAVGVTGRGGRRSLPRRWHHAGRLDARNRRTSRTRWSTSTRCPTRRSTCSRGNFTSAPWCGCPISPLIRWSGNKSPMIGQALELSASAQLRNMASIGGNLLQRTQVPVFPRRVSRVQPAHPGCRLRGDRRA